MMFDLILDRLRTSAPWHQIPLWVIAQCHLPVPYGDRRPEEDGAAQPANLTVTGLAGDA